MASRADVPGYASMVRFKGMFTETIAPRKLTALSGSQPSIPAIQAFAKSVSEAQAAALPPEVRERLDKLPPGEREQAVRAYAALSQSRSAAENAASQEWAQLPPDKREEFSKLPPAERSKAVAAWWRAWATPEHMGPHGLIMPNPQDQQLVDLAWQAGLAMGPQSLASAKPLEFLTYLQPNEVFADLYKYKIREGDHFGAEHYLMVVSASGAPSRVIQLGDAAPIDSAIDSFYSLRAAPASNAAPSSTTPGRGVNVDHQDHTAEKWKALQTLVLAPILRAIPSGTSRLILSPDSSLALLPFASLALDMGVSIPIAVVPSAYDFVRLRTSQVPVAAPRLAVIVGDLDYGAGDGGFGELPGTKQEVKDVAGLAANAGFQIAALSGSAVTRKALFDNIRDATMLHIATHGIWSSSSSNSVAQAFDNARLALSQANSGSPSSMLAASDILHLNLSKVQLVTLSACSSGQGRPVDGQGLLGFQTAFMAAGVRTLLISMWQVPDRATAELMRAFYQALWRDPSLTKSAALRQAQMQLRANPTFADPRNWAAWVLVGDPQ